MFVCDTSGIHDELDDSPICTTRLPTMCVFSFRIKPSSLSFPAFSVPSAGGSAALMSEFTLPQPSALTQAVLTGVRIAKRLENAQHTLREAIDASLLSEHDLARFSKVAHHLAGTQHMATTLAMPL